MWSLIALLGLTIPPGLALGLALTRWDRTDPDGDVFLTRTASMALIVWVLVSQILARTVGIGPVPAWWAVGTVGLAGVLVVGAMRKQLLANVGSLAYGLGVMGCAALIFAPVIALTVRTAWGLVGTTPWYYWNLAEQVAQAGDIPRTSTEWGVDVPFLADYQAFSSATALLIRAGNGMAAVRIVIVFTVLLAALAIVMVAREFGASRLPALMAVPVFLSLAVFGTKFSGYRPESFAYVIGLLIVANAIGWLRRREKGGLLAAVGLAAILSQIHLIVGLITALLLGALTLALAVAERPLRALFLRAATLAGACLAAAGLAVLAFGRSATSVNLEPVSSRVGDPSWEFNVAIQALPYSHPPSGFQLAPPWVFDGFNLAPGWPYWTLIAATVAGALVMVVRGRREVREALATSIVFWILVLVVVMVIVTHWDTFVPRRTGGQRALQLAPIMLPVLIAVLMSSLQRNLRRWGVVTVLSALSAFAFVSSMQIADAGAIQRPSAQTVAELEALKLPAKSTVLTNAYTEGAVERTLGARGLLEGRAPYTFPSLLTRANRQLRDAQRFFANPVANASVLDRYSVDYVLISDRRWSMSNGYVFKVNTDLLKRQARLRHVETFDDAILYRVDSKG